MVIQVIVPSGNARAGIKTGDILHLVSGSGQGTWVHGRRARLVAHRQTRPPGNLGSRTAECKQYSGVGDDAASLISEIFEAYQLNVFVVGTNSRVYTAAWKPGFTDGLTNLNGVLK